MSRSSRPTKLLEIARTLRPLPVSRPYSGKADERVCGGEKSAKGLVLGIHSHEPPNTHGNNYNISPQTNMAGEFTPAAERFNVMTHGLLAEHLRVSGPPLLEGNARIFYNLHPSYPYVVLVGLGSECTGYDENEHWDERKEVIRNAAAIGCQMLQDNGVLTINVEGFGCTEAAAEGAALGVWFYQELKNASKKILIPNLELHDDCDREGWHIGLQKAAAQNLARQLMDTPANLMSPTSFAQTAVEVLCKSGVNVEVKVQGWLEVKKMGAFLSVAKGSCEPPIFLELSYYGASYEERPVVLIGSGVTFDSGGLCLKAPHIMKNMRGDMAGAACLVAAMRAVARLRLPINIRGLIPLCENMPGCFAYKPGDIVTSMSGKKIRIEDTRSEGRLLLADTLYYAQNFWPKFILDVGSLTEDVQRGLGSSAAGVFTNSERLWDKLHWAGVQTGDRLWRLPLWDYYTKQVLETRSADTKNSGRGKGGGASKAAAFLHEFVPCGEWVHIDTYGVMTTNGMDARYLRPGMSGRPTRTLIEFLSELTCAECN